MYLGIRRFVLLPILLIIIFSPVQQSFADWIRQETGVRDNLFDIFFLTESLGYSVGWGSSPGGVVLKTTDGGENWSSSVPVRNSYLFSIVFLDSYTGYAAGYDGETSRAMIISTIDGGENWARETFRESFGFYRLQFVNEQTGFVCGYNGAIMRASFGGLYWELLDTDTDETFRMLHFPTEETGYAVAWEADRYLQPSKMYKTSDSGDEWDLVHDFGANTVIGGLHFMTADHGFISGNDGYECIYETEDGGENWNRIFRSDVRVVLQDIHFNGDFGWCMSDRGRIIATQDAGESWELEEVEDRPQLFYKAYSVGETVYACATGGDVYRNTFENGVSAEWKPILPGQIEILSSYPNPFNSTIRLEYRLNMRMNIDVAVYNPFGQRIAVLDHGIRNAGYQNLTWNAQSVPSGIYLCRINYLDQVQTTKLILIR